MAVMSGRPFVATINLLLYVSSPHSSHSPREIPGVPPLRRFCLTGGSLTHFGTEIDAFMLLLQVTCHCSVDQPVALDHVQRRAEGRAVPVDHRERPTFWP